MATGFWLPATYSAASPPVAAIFAILTKVGVYILLRLSMLLFGSDAGASLGFGQPVLLYGGLLTIGFGAIGVLASQAMGRLAGYCVLVSSGTLMAATRPWQWRGHRWRAVLSRQLDTDDLRLLPVDRTGGTRP